MEPRPPDNVYPLGGHRLPPPPGWVEPPAPEETLRPRKPVAQLGPDDFLASGKLRCAAKSRVNQERCKQPAVIGSYVCRYHGAGGEMKHPDDPASAHHEGTLARARVIEAVRSRLDHLAEKAAVALERILDSEDVKPSDLLKAIELTLDRSVGKQIAIEKTDSAKRDLDAEILELVNQQQTGTDG